MVVPCLSSCQCKESVSRFEHVISWPAYVHMWGNYELFILASVLRLPRTIVALLICEYVWNHKEKQENACLLPLRRATSVAVLLCERKDLIISCAFPLRASTIQASRAAGPCLCQQQHDPHVFIAFEHSLLLIEGHHANVGEKHFPGVWMVLPTSTDV